MSSAATAGLIIWAVLFAGVVYFVEVGLSPHPATGPAVRSQTEQTSTYPIYQSSSTSQSAYASSFSASAASGESVSTGSTGETTSTSSELGIAMVVNATILDAGQAYDECGNSTGCDRMIYIINMTVFNTGMQGYTFNELDLRLKTDAGNTYPTYPIVYAIMFPANGHPHPLQTTETEPGTRTAGEEGFEIPSSASPTQLLYQDPYAGVNATANVPPVTSWVSEVSTVGEASIWPSDMLCGAIGNDQQPLCYTATYVGMNHSILGSADYFTGEVMAFNVTLTLGKGQVGPSPGTVAIRSAISAFFVKHVFAPQCVGGVTESCENWTIVVLLVPEPDVSYYGDPNLTVSLPPA